MTVEPIPPKPGLGGSGHHKRRKDPDRVRKHAFRRSPCGRPPIAPTGLVGEFDRAESGKHLRIRTKVRWGEVVLDTSGFPIRLRSYICELEYTANGSDWFQARRATVSAKDDVDASNKAHHIFKGVQKDLGYRFRVRAVARDGCRSAWSDWDVIGNPGTDEPPAPSNVTIIDNDKHMRLTIRWDAPHIGSDPSDLFDDRVDHFVIHISKAANFSTEYRRVRNKGGQHESIRIDDADENDAFYARVRSVSADKDLSAWIPAKLTGNSDPGASPDAVHVGRAMEKTKKPKTPTGLSLTFSSDDDGGTRYDRSKAKVLWNEVVQDINNNDIDLGGYAVQFQKSNDGTTWTSDVRKFFVTAKDADADTTNYKIIHNINGKKFYRARVRAVSESHTRSDWTSWTSDGNQPGTLSVPTPLNVTVRHQTKGKDRIVVDWEAPADPDDNDLPDARVHFYQVGVKKGGVTQPSTLASCYRFDRKVMGSRQSFFVPQADEESNFYAWVRCVDDSGNKSVWIPGTRTGNSTAGTVPEPMTPSDGVPVGTVRKFATPTVPNGWLRCDGAALSTTAYPELFAELQYRYGGSGTTFNIPDHRKRQGRGVGTGQFLGESEGQAEGSRDEDHGKHNLATHGKHRKHRHKHHHKVKHPNHDQHSNTDPAEGGQHDHPAQGSVSGNLHSDTTENFATVPRGTATTFAAGPTHSHTIVGSTGRQGSSHSHSGSVIQGTQAKFLGYIQAGDYGAHLEHSDAAAAADGQASLFTSSLTGGTHPVAGSWTGEETDTAGVPLDIDELGSAVGRGHLDHLKPDDDDGVRGHKKHPYVRFHYNIKAVP